MLPSTEWKRKRLQASPSSRSGTPARRSRSASARATTTSPCCSWRRPRPRWSAGGAALQAAPGARGRGRRHARAQARWRSDALDAAAVQARARRADHASAMYGVTQEGTSARSFVGAPLQDRRQDRHGAGRRHQGRTRSTTPPSSTSTSATTRCTSPSRRSTSPTIALALIVENAGFGAGSRGADRAPRVRLPAARPVPERGRHRARRAQGQSIGADRHAAAGRRDVPLPRRRRPTAAAGARRRRAAAAERRRRAAAARLRPPMSAVFEQPSLWQRVAAGVHRLRRPARRSPSLLLAAAGLVTMYSAGFDHGTRFVDHGRNMLLALGVLFVVAQVPPQQLMRSPCRSTWSAWRCWSRRAAGVRHHARRARRAGSTSACVIQPSEIMKIAMPLMLAWWFQQREGQLRALDFLIAGAAAAGAGRPDRQAARPRHRDPGALGRPVRDLLRRPVVEADHAGAAARRRRRSPRWSSSEDAICQPDVKWPMLRDYQKNRVCTLLDPTTDPLGKGFHIIQGDDRDRLGRHRPARAS